MKNENFYGWIFSSDKENKIIVQSKEEFLESSSFFHIILEAIQDGVSVLDENLNVLYQNTTISQFFLQDTRPNQKCYYIYHKRKAPCKNCPALQAFRTKKPAMDMISYKRKGNQTSWHELFAIPIFNHKNEVILIINYIRDVTLRTIVQSNMEKIEQKYKALEKQNEMLLQMLNQHKQSQNELEETISVNVEKFIKPSLDYLKKTADFKDIDLVNSIIDEIVYPIAKRRPNTIAALTPKEMQIASLIKEGYQSKEIADRLYVSQKAVDYHRLNIRKKLNLKRSSNLRSYLKIYL